MAHIDHKSPTMTLYTRKHDPIVHWVGMVLAEKTIIPNIVFVDPKNPPTELKRINPLGVFPFLVDQQRLMLYTPYVMVGYIDERFPHPPLLPVSPIARAKYQQTAYQIAEYWYPLLNQIEAGDHSKQAQDSLQEGLATLSPLFDIQPYFLSDEITLVDCCIVPLLYRLQMLEIDLVQGMSSLISYQTRLFARQTFQDSLKQLEMSPDTDDVEF